MLHAKPLPRTQSRTHRNSFRRGTGADLLITATHSFIPLSAFQKDKIDDLGILATNLAEAAHPFCLAADANAVRDQHANLNKNRPGGFFSKPNVELKDFLVARKAVVLRLRRVRFIWGWPRSLADSFPSKGRKSAA